MTTRRIRQTRASANPRAIANVADVLRARWDPAGALATPTGDRTAEAHAHVLVGMVAADGTTEQLANYLLWAETTGGGEPRLGAEAREQLAGDLLRFALGLDDPGAPPPAVF